MPRLIATDFNTARFFGCDGTMPGGYGGPYQPIHYNVNPAYNSTPENDAWYGRAQTFVANGKLVGLKVLELGCAYGSLVRHLRSMGADAYGLDLSWPISQGIALWPELQPYLYLVLDVKAFLAGSNREINEWDAVVSRHFLECFSDVELAVMIPRINQICRKQIHMVDLGVDPEYYNQKTLAQWQALPFEAGTIILDG
jgi:2-polyprenyl-3-methyl-5-hydroxy-6-metoxy-1,4-benzoquinol methylase